MIAALRFDYRPDVVESILLCFDAAVPLTYQMQTQRIGLVARCESSAAYTRNDCVICWPPKKKPNNQYADRVHYVFVQTQTRHAKYIHGSNCVPILVDFLLNCFRFQFDLRFFHAHVMPRPLTSNFFLRKFWNYWLYFILHCPVWTSSHSPKKMFLRIFLPKTFSLISSIFLRAYVSEPHNINLRINVSCTFELLKFKIKLLSWAVFPNHSSSYFR